jgi:hypothetical protein
LRKIQYIGLKKDNTSFRIVSSENFKKELNLLPEGRYKVTVEKYRKNKSNPQLGWLFACIYPFVLRGLNDLGWEITSLDDVDILCKDKFASKEIVNINSGEIMEIPALKRDMTTTEFSTYVEAIRKWASEDLMINIPDPETNLEIEYK